MANWKGPSEGGSGGKRGHSSMEHWTRTDDLKTSSRKRRRGHDKTSAIEGLEEHENDESDTDEDDPLDIE